MATLVNLNELLSALGPLGVASGRVEVGVGSGAEGVSVGVSAGVGVTCDVGLEPAQAPITNAAASSAASERMVPEVYLRQASSLELRVGWPYDASVAEGNGIVREFYRGWELYQGRLIGAIAPLDQDQLNLAAAPHLWSVRMLACHIVAARSWWLHTWMGEGSPEFGKMTQWDEDEALATRPASEIVRGLEESWAVMKAGLDRWTPDDMLQEFIRPVPNEAGERPRRNREFIVWHLIEHDLHHGGEISFSLGMHGVPGLDL